MKIDINQISEEYFERIHRAALVLTGNPWDADDLTQETFLVLARQPDRYQGRSKLFTWLYGILLNLERRERRRRQTRQRGLRVVSDYQHGERSSEPAATCRLEVEEWKSSLWSRVAQLPDGQRQSLVLRFSEGLSYTDIAQVLECPLGTVKSRIFNGLANLRELLEEDGDRAHWFSQQPTDRGGRAAES